MYLIRHKSKTKCDICDRDVEYISYLNIDIEDEFDNVDDDNVGVIAASYSCDHCGFGFAYSNDKYVIGASNAGNCPINRYMYVDNLIKFIESDHWIGPDIDEFLYKWHILDDRLQENSKQYKSTL